MEYLSKEELELFIFSQTGISVIAEDRIYTLHNITWPFKQPWYGLKKFFYVEEGCDCDDFARILEYELLVRHLKDAYKGLSLNGVGTYPALPMGKIKVKYKDDTFHWFNFVVCGTKNEPILIYCERTGDNIIIPISGWTPISIQI